MSPVIILGLVVLWAAVLVPMWLRRHEEDEEVRSVDRFSGAMRTLARRERSGERYVVMPHRTRAVDVHVSGAADPTPDGNDHELSEETAGAFPRKAHDRLPLTAAQRRQRTLAGLLLVTVLTLLLVVVIGGVLLLSLQVIADVALLGFLAQLRRCARQAAAASRQRRRVAVAPAGSVAAAPAASIARERVAPPPPPRIDETWADEILVDTSVEPAAGGEWDPVPVPRPTYTMKPAAPARRRRSAPLADPEVADYVEPGAGASTDIDDDTVDDVGSLDDILTYRAVNE